MEESLSEILEKLELDDMIGDTRMIAEIVGIDVARALMNHFDGLSLSIQKVKYMDKLLVRHLRIKYPCAEYSKRELLKISKEIQRNPRETKRLMKMR